MNTKLYHDALIYCDSFNPPESLPVRDRLLLYIMATNADSDGILKGFTQNRLTALMGAGHRNTVVRSMKSLRAKGVVRNIKRERVHNEPVTYRIEIPAEYRS